MSRLAPQLLAAATASILLCGATTPARAQDEQLTIFDFTDLADGQTGSYVAGAGSEIVDGTVRLSAIEGWADRAQRIRVPVAVSNTGTELSRHVLPIFTDALPPEIRARSLADGADMGFYTAEGAPAAHLVGGVFMPAEHGFFLVRADTLPVGDTTFFAYVGSGTRLPALDELSFFTLPTPTVRYFPLDQTPTGGDGTGVLTLVSARDGNRVLIGETEESLDALAVRVATGAELGFSFAAAAPMAGVWDGTGGDSVSPESFAGTEFVSPASRYEEYVVIGAPFGDTTVTFTSPPLAPVTVPSGTVALISTPLPDPPTSAGPFGTVAFTTDVPVVVGRGYLNGASYGDVTPVPPTSERLLGLTSGILIVGAGPSGATVVASSSQGTETTLILGPHESIPVPRTIGAAQGTGEAIFLRADAPIAAFTYGDGDGGEAVTALPIELLSRQAVLPRNAEFLAIASLRPVTCELTSDDGTVLESGTTALRAAPSPGKLFFGDGNIASATAGVVGPSLLTCDGPVYALFEDGGNSATEKLLLPFAAHRGFSTTPVETSVRETVETRFAAGAVTVRTPSYAPARPMASIVSLEAAATIEAGGSLRFRVSLDGGSTWRVPRDGVLVPGAENEAVEADAFAGVDLERSASISVEVRLDTDGTADVAVDALNLVVALVPPPAQLVLGSIPSPQRVGEPFSVGIRLRDSFATVVEVDVTVEAVLEPTSVGDPFTVPLVAGEGTITVTPAAAAETAFLIVNYEEVTVSSDAFTVLEAAAAGSRLRARSGDQQQGEAGMPLMEPLVVALTDGSGAALAGEALSFEIRSGDGSLSEMSATTDDDGLASTSWTLGPDAGTQRVAVLLVSEPSVQVVFEATSIAPTSGCACRAGRSAGFGAAWPLLPLLLLAARRRS